MTKSVFLAVNASLRCLNNVVGVYLVPYRFLLHIGQQGLADFFRYRPLLPIGWKTVQILRQRRRKTTNTAPTTLSAICTSSKPIHFCSIHNYTQPVISRNDKNRKLTLLSQRKLALTARNTLFKIIGAPKKFKTSRFPYLSLVL